MIHETTYSVLVAASNYLSRKGIISILKSLSFISNVEEVSAGIEVIHTHEKKCFDFIILDILSSPVDNIELVAYLKEKNSSSKIIVLLNPYDQYNIKHFFNAGVTAILMRNSVEIDFKTNLFEIISGKKVYPNNLQEILERFEKTDPEHKYPENKFVLNRFREVIYLLCLEMTSKEIADILCVSVKTIDKDRLTLSKMLNVSGVCGIIRHGMQIDILSDETLQSKFEKYLLPVYGLPNSTQKIG
jgi:DNA-binding NarL/FixJ family response regulator